MPLTSPGNDDDTGENHQPTLRKNTAEPVEQTLKQNIVRVGALGLGVFEHPVAGRLGNAQDPALRRYRAAAGVGPYHACFRANTGAACSETSTSISSCLSRFRNSISSFSSGVRLSAAFVEPLLRIPLHPTPQRGTRDAVLRPDLRRRLAVPVTTARSAS